jgi:hypothetical protein
MVGGERAAYDRVLPLFNVMGKNVNLMGGPGAGQHTKMTNQILIATNMVHFTFIRIATRMYPQSFMLISVKCLKYRLV